MPGELPVALRESQRRYAKEIRRGLEAKTGKQKKALVAEWEGKYDAIMVKELIAIMKDRKVAISISNWDQEFKRQK